MAIPNDEVEEPNSFTVRIFISKNACLCVPCGMNETVPPNSYRGEHRRVIFPSVLPFKSGNKSTIVNSIFSHQFTTLHQVPRGSTFLHFHHPSLQLLLDISSWHCATFWPDISATSDKPRIPLYNALVMIYHSSRLEAASLYRQQSYRRLERSTRG